MKLKSIVPWWFKIAAKVVLARLPFGYWFWQKIGLFRHGYMDNSEYAMSVFNSHLKCAAVDNNLSGKVILEIGPGDTVSTALIARAYGGKAILVDAGDYADKNNITYRSLAKHLASQGKNVPEITKTESFDGVLDICNARYLTEGIHSLKNIEDKSVDLIFSHAVLEHIRKNEFLETMRECRRVIKDGGVATHQIDLKDHLCGGLNNLRFSEELWESNFFVRSGFYTNRLRYSKILAFMQDAGFEVDVVNVDRWEQMPIERKKMHPIFSSISDDDLLISGFRVLLRPI